MLNPERPPLVLRSEPTTAEYLLICRAIELVDVAGGRPPEVAYRGIWPWLLQGERLARSGAEPKPVDLDRLVQDEWLLMSLQPQLLSAWSVWCRATRTAELPLTILHGTAQHTIGTALAHAWTHAPDRLEFLGDLAVEIGRLPFGAWISTRGEHSITTWLKASRCRAAIPRLLLETFGRWGDTWRATGFVDDGYDHAQRCLSRFERPLNAMGRLRDVVNRAESLREIG